MFIFSAQNNALTITGSVRIVESSIKLSMIYHIQKKEYILKLCSFLEMLR